MLLDNKTIIVTGAASPRGIGKATARALAAHGARIAILDLRREDAEAAAAEARALRFSTFVAKTPRRLPPNSGRAISGWLAT